MKINKLYENNNSHFDAKLLSKKFGKIFFSELEEFNKIIVTYNDDLHSFNFSFCFGELFEETIEQVNKLYVFVGLRKNGWSFETNDFEDGNGFVIILISIYRQYQLLNIWKKLK
jgi:hypothetical protein